MSLPVLRRRLFYVVVLSFLSRHPERSEGSLYFVVALASPCSQIRLIRENPPYAPSSWTASKAVPTSWDVYRLRLLLPLVGTNILIATNGSATRRGI
jgi:hypothetical protein